MWAEKNNRAIKFFTARPNGILRGGVGSVNRRRPLKPRWAEQLAASMIR